MPLPIMVIQRDSDARHHQTSKHTVIARNGKGNGAGMTKQSPKVKTKMVMDSFNGIASLNLAFQPVSSQ